MTAEVKITYFGQSCFYIQYKNKNFIIDPGTKNIPDNIEVNYIFVTHKHADHISELKKIAKNNPEAVIIGNSDVISSFKDINNEMKVICNRDSLSFDSFVMKFVNCRHGVIRWNINTGIILILNNNMKIGHIGDAVEYNGFKNENLDIFMIPIGGIFTTSPNKAINELKKFKILPSRIIPMHWLFRNPKSFCAKISKTFESKIQCKVLRKSQSFSI